MQILITGANVYREGRFQKADLLLTDGVITAVEDRIPVSSEAQVFSFDNSILIPGFADVHVHLREPGFSYKETIASGTQAAAQSGYSVLCAMPNLSAPPDTPEHIEVQRGIIRRDARVRVLPYACITMGQAGGGGHLLPFLHRRTPVPYAPQLRRPENSHLPVDGYCLGSAGGVRLVTAALCSWLHRGKDS